MTSKGGVRAAALSTVDRLKLQIETGCSEKTIRKWIGGQPVRGATQLRLEKGCKKLGLEVLA